MSRSSRGFIDRGVFARGFLVAVLALSAGCAHSARVNFETPTAERRGVRAQAETARPEAVRAMPLASPVAEEVAPHDAWWMAEAVAEARGNCETLIGSGGSMLPLYRDRTVLVVERMEMAQLKPGMTVVFFGDSGRMVAHTLLARTPQGWVAQGLANRERDRTLVRQRNYVGTVIRAFAPNPRIASTRIRVLPVSTSGPTGEVRVSRPSPEMLLALAPARGN